MSFQEAFVWTLLRSLVVACLAVPVSTWLARIVLSASGRLRFWSLLLVLAPILAPDLVVGYSYRSFDLSLLHRPNLNHCYYVVLVFLKFLPAAAVVRLCSPPAPVSQMALHCARLVGGRLSVAVSGRGFWLRTELLQHLPAFGIVFLLAMQEFEIASLMQIPAWTVHLFDAQAGGLNPGASVRKLLIPVLAQVLVAVFVIWSVVAGSRQATPRWMQDRVVPSGSSWPGVVVAALAIIVLWVVPVCIVSLSGLRNISGVLQNEVLVTSTLMDLVAAIVLAVSCSILSMVAARIIREVVVSCGQDTGQLIRIRGLVVMLLAILPGLFGILAVSTVIVLLVQLPMLIGLRSTVWPMALALVLFLVPRAFLLILLLPAYRDSESSHLATLLGDSSGFRRQAAARLKWWYEVRPVFLVAAVLFYWSLSNLTAAAMLCPATIPVLSFDGNIVPLPLRLYKFIHQGRTATLSVMALLSVIAPLVLIGLTMRIAPQLYLRFSSSGPRKC